MEGDGEACQPRASSSRVAPRSFSPLARPRPTNCPSTPPADSRSAPGAKYSEDSPQLDASSSMKTTDAHHEIDAVRRLQLLGTVAEHQPRRNQQHCREQVGRAPQQEQQHVGDHRAEWTDAIADHLSVAGIGPAGITRGVGDQRDQQNQREHREQDGNTLPHCLQHRLGETAPTSYRCGRAQTGCFSSNRVLNPRCRPPCMTAK